MTYTKMPYAFRPAELTQAEIDNLPDEWGLLYLNGDTDLLETIRRGGDKSGLQTFADHRDREDAWVDKTYVGGNPNIFTHILHAIAADAVAILVKDAGDTAAIIITSVHEVQLLTGTDADTTTVPVDITCPGSLVTFEQLNFATKTLSLTGSQNTAREIIFSGTGQLILGGGVVAALQNRAIECRFTSVTDICLKVSETNNTNPTLQALHFRANSGVNEIQLASAGSSSLQQLQIVDCLSTSPAVTGYKIETASGGTVLRSVIQNVRLYDADKGAIHLIGSLNEVSGSTLTGDTGTTPLMHFETVAGTEIQSTLRGGLLRGTGRLLGFTGADADMQGMKVVGVTFADGGNILSGANVTYLGCDFGNITLNVNSKTGVTIIGGDGTDATFSNLNADTVFRSVKGQDDRGDIVHGTGSIRLKDNIELELGDAGDVEMFYDGTNMILNPKAVGSGILELLGNLRLKVSNPVIDWEDTAQASPLGKFRIASVFDVLAIQGRNAADNAFETIATFERLADTGSFFINTIGEQTVAAGVTIDSVLLKDGLVDNVDIAARDHAASHTAVSHSDQGATGAELETLTDGSDAGTLHLHQATNVTYASAVNADWDGGTDPGSTKDGLDQLAERTKDLETVTLWWPAVQHVDAAEGSTSTFPIVIADSTQKMRIAGAIPDDFVSIVSCELVIVPSGTHTMTVDFIIGSVAPGETAGANDATNANMAKDLTNDQITEWDLLTADSGSSILPTVAAGDYMGFRMDSDVNTLRVVGIKFVYVRT